MSEIVNNGIFYSEPDKQKKINIKLLFLYFKECKLFN